MPRQQDDIQQILWANKLQIETLLKQLLTEADADIAGLQGAMAYGAAEGGKRLRGFLLMEAARLASADEGNALHAAAALEMVHGYSLIHDDLPAMDDDSIRHGKPCTHLAFDEATAILAGDGLLTFAFDILSRAETHADSAVRLSLVRILAQSAGHKGMAGGQYLDMQAEGKTLDEAGILRLQSLKTGALFEASLQMGARLGNPSDKMLQELQAYGQKIGLAFQICDDLLDVVGDEGQMGKKIGKDIAQGKASFLAINTVEKARQKAYDLQNEASQHIVALTGHKQHVLIKLADFVVNRIS